ncbi:hypothetical protein GCM10008110_09400 [Marinobacter persicus]|nr:hypothetical protein GCM10008110_09400 [Marinobacter persicus]
MASNSGKRYWLLRIAPSATGEAPSCRPYTGTATISIEYTTKQNVSDTQTTRKLRLASAGEMSGGEEELKVIVRFG